MEQVSVILQGKNTNVQEALSAAKIAELFLKKQRQESECEAFYSTTVTEAQKYYSINPGSSTLQMAT